MNICEVCFQKKTITFVIAFALLIAGIKSYFSLGRLEDPEFTIRSAQVITAYPGASAREVAERVSDPLEAAVQSLGRVKHVTSVSYPGRSILSVELRDDCLSKDLPQLWDELRRKVGDFAPNLPDGCSTPLVYDDYGDVYGVFYAISGDGYTYAELLEQAKLLRRELLLCTDVAKISLLGVQDEVIVISPTRSKFAATSVTPTRIAELLRSRLAPADAGSLSFAEKSIRLHPTGELKTCEDFRNLLLADGVLLGDVAEVTREYVDPPSMVVKRNGKPCIGLGISTRKGGNVITMGEAVEKRMRELLSETPIGMEVDVISHQATSVKSAIDGFVENLIESVILVIAVLLVTMGMRSGFIIGGVLILTVFATVFVMDQMGLMFERISLGAFIIALGMLVDNAIVITEAVLVASQKGESKVKAAVDVVRQTQWSLLGGTAIAILSFAPIGASQNSTGEYCRSLFLVIAISLFLSWVLAITVAPLVAEKFLPMIKPKGNGNEDPYGGLFFRVYRAFLKKAVDNRFFSLLVLVCLLVMSFVGFGWLDQNFFPDSTRPQFMVHVWMNEGTHISKTSACVDRVSEFASKLDGVTGVSSFTGGGAIRFLLTYSPEDADSAYGLLLVDVQSDKQISELMAKIEAEAPGIVPEADVSCQRFVLGPGDAQKIQVRLTGPDPVTLRAVGEEVLTAFRADPMLKEVQSDWRNRADMTVPVVSERRALKLGLSRADVARSLKYVTDGLPVGQFVEKDDLHPIILRAPEAERNDLNSAWVWSDAFNIRAPILQVLDGVEESSEELRLKRRDRKFCLTAKCNPKDGVTAAAAFDHVLPRLKEIAAKLPPGYNCEWGGEYENSRDAQKELAPTFLPILALMVMIVVFLFNSLKKTAVIFMTLPLILVGVVAGLLIFGQPFGFMALLGLLSLVGMQVKNAIVLMDEIGANIERGLKPYDAIVEAGVSRLRPVANGALTTILGMLPLLTDAFYAAMAVTIMIGLMFATILTMVVIPVNYAIVFKVKK